MSVDYHDGEPRTVGETVPMSGPSSAGTRPRSGGQPRRHTAGILTAASITGGVLNYSYAVLLTYRLAPSQYSVFAAAQSLVLIVGVIGSAGVPWVLAQETMHADRDGDRQRLDRAVSFAFWANAALGLLAAAIMGGAVLSFGSRSDALVVAATAFILFAGSTGFAVLQGRGRTGLLALLVVLEVVVKVVVGFLLVSTVRPTAASALGGNFAGACVFLGTLPAVARYVGGPKQVSSCMSLLRAAGRMGALQVGVGVMSSLDTVFAGSLAAARGAGAAYQVASTIGKIPLFISSAVSTAVFPTLTVGGVHRRVDALRSYGLIAGFIWLALLTVPNGLVQAVFADNYSSISQWLAYTAASGAALGAVNLLTTFVQSYPAGRPGRPPLGAVMIVCVGVSMFAATALGSALGGLRGLATGTVVGGVVSAAAFALLPGERTAVLAAARLLARPRRRLGYVLAAALALSVAGTSIRLWVVTAAIIGSVVVVAAFPEYGAAVSRAMSPVVHLRAGRHGRHRPTRVR